MDKTLKIGTHSFQSRLMVRTGKYRDFEETKIDLLIFDQSSKNKNKSFVLKGLKIGNQALKCGYD